MNSSANAKGDLIARLISLGLGMPTFGGEASGPAHDRTFRATVSLGGRELGSGVGRTKKDAERLASEQVLASLNDTDGPGTVTTDPEPQRSWPIYAAVLAQAVEAASEFAAPEATLQDVQRDAAQFYRALLSDLGHRPGAAEEA